MNLKTRLTIKFMSQVFVLFGIVCVLGIALVLFIWRELNEGSTRTDPAILVKTMPLATTVQGTTVSMADWLLADVDQDHGWVQILNNEGHELYAHHRPESVPSDYPPGLLLEYRAYPQRYGFRVYSWYDIRAGKHLTWLLGVPYTDTPTLLRVAPFAAMVVMFFVSIVVTVIVALLFGRRLGSPLLHMMTWLQRLGRGTYEEPKDPHGIPRSRLRNGLLKKSYRLYAEVISALDHLSSALRDAQISRHRLEATRDEWITGVSHDLRTPLSSVKGYGDLLVEQSYDWSPEEIRKFGSIIVEKAMHMEELIQDLGLTFRLRNQALPLECTPKNVVEVVRRAVIDLVNRPVLSHQEVVFESEVDEIDYPLDAKWFTRALDNLLTNAVLHNPVDTTIKVSVRQSTQTRLKYTGVDIEITDNGAGMDADTVAHLFDRYYRGTNTSEKHSKGSGLGCAIAQQLIEAHGGTVRVTSTVGVGSTFLVSLPAKN